jgi:hypothetical protein
MLPNLLTFYYESSNRSLTKGSQVALLLCYFARARLELKAQVYLQLRLKKINCPLQWLTSESTFKIFVAIFPKIADISTSANLENLTHYEQQMCLFLFRTTFQKEGEY